MMKETYQPVTESKIDGRYFPVVIGLYDDYEGFRILLKNNDDIYGIYFDDSIIYRNTDEGNRVGSIVSQKIRLENSTFVFKVENSRFVEWFLSEAVNKYKGVELIHYAIVTEADWIDVITISEPRIKLLNK